MLVPEFSEGLLPENMARRFADAGGALVVGEANRNALVDLLFESVSKITPEIKMSADRETVADFFALGYCYLQIQLMTRQLR